MTAAEVRAKILSIVSANGGHLSSSLGAVELCMALVRAFDPRKDRIVWDVGHQAYAWKILTDRNERFATLRQFGGLSGFPNPEESPCDAFVGGHAGAALAVAAGMAAARDLAGRDEHVVAVVGDAALANGMAREALQTPLARRLILVVNDNCREGRFDDAFFAASGFRYMGPVDGHDVEALMAAFARAKEFSVPVAVHVRTAKGRGFAPAEQDPSGWHGVSPFSLDNPLDRDCPRRGWSEVMGSCLQTLARSDSRICALTAAMPGGTGLRGFAREFPERFFDPGICEEQVVSFAAGLAKAGMRPVVAIYSTFLQRAVDQIMHDVCILKLPVVFAIDRAGCVGQDGRTHHGMFDIPMLKCLPNLSILQPRDAQELETMLAAAVAKDGPVAIRYPRGLPPSFAHQAVLDAFNAVRMHVDPASRIAWGAAQPLVNPDAKLQIWTLGDQVAKALSVAEILSHRGIDAGVVDARFVKPFDAELLARQRSTGAFVASIENGAVAGGFGESIGADIRFGWPDAFVGHGTIDELEREHRFTADDVASCLADAVARKGLD